MNEDTSVTPGVTPATSTPGGITDVNLARSLVGDLLTPQNPQTPAPVTLAEPVAPAVRPDGTPAPVTPPVAPAPVLPTAPDALRNRFSGQPTVPTAPVTPDLPVVPEVPPGVDPNKPESKQQVFTWGKLRSEHDQFRKEVVEKAKALEAAEAEKQKLAEEKALIDAERQKIIQERDTLSERLGKVSLAESPEFQARFDGKMAEIQDKLAADLVRYSGVKQEEASQEAYNMITADTKQLAEMLKDNPQMLGRVMTRVEEAAAIWQQRDEELKNWRQTSAALGVREAQAQVIRSTEERRTWADMAIDLAKQTGHPIFSAVEGDAKVLADEIAMQAHGFVQTATEEELTRAAVEGFANPYLYQTVNQLIEENRMLRDRIEGGYRMAAPPLYPFGGTTPPPPAPPAPPPNVHPVQKPDNPYDVADTAIKNALSNLGMLRG